MDLLEEVILFTLKQRENYDDQILELPETLGSAGKVLVVDTMDGSFTLRTKWGNPPVSEPI